MATSDAKTENVPPSIRIPKEHAPLDYLLSQIPKKAQKGMLIQCDLSLLSIDANEHFIVLGSNVGVVFLYKRKEKELERLRTHSHNDVIISVALHSGLEQQIAAGTEKGVVYLFQLPSTMPSQSKQLQQFIVKDIHKSSITCLAWSLNGMKLFSGDKKGIVACTEVDFYTGVCETNICLIENNCEIVQLNHAHKALLVSTNHRSVIYRTDIKTGLVQIGQKERKIYGNFGAVFILGLCKPEDAELYACRPGLRIWKSKMDGSVTSTYLFKELINNPHPTLELLPFNRKSKMFLPESQFGPLHLYKDKYIVTWSDSSLFILNTDNTSVIGGSFHIGPICHIAVTNDEIFVLRKETDRNVIRIAERPESLAGNTYHRLVKDHAMPDFMTGKSAHADDTQTIPSPLKFIKENVLDKIKNIDISSDGTSSVSGLAASVDKHTEQKELPPIVKLDNPDLMTIEIFSGDKPSQEPVDQTKHSPIRRERFNPFTKEDSNDFGDELDTSSLLECNKPKTIPSDSSQSNTLQLKSVKDSDSHQISPANAPQPVTSQSGASQKTPSQLGVSQQTTSQPDVVHQMTSKPVITGPQPDSDNKTGALDRIRKVPIEDSNDDVLAVSVKTKKKKKKKTDHKLSPSLKSQDSDTVSQNSVEEFVTSAQRAVDNKSDTENKLQTDKHDKTNVTVDISDIVGLKPIQDKNNEKTERKTDSVESKMSLEDGTKLETAKESDVKKSDNNVTNDNKAVTKDGDKMVPPKMGNVPIATVSDVGNNETKVTENIRKPGSVPEGKKTSETKTGVVSDQHVEVKTKTPSDIVNKPQHSSDVDLKAKTMPIVEVKEKSLADTKTHVKPSSAVDTLFDSKEKSHSDIAAKVKHSKTHKDNAFLKLEKNLASLEENLISYTNDSPYGSYKVPVNNINDKKDLDKSLDLSQEDSGHHSIGDDRDIFSTQVGDSGKSDTFPGSPVGASSPLNQDSRKESFYKSSADSSDDFYGKYNSPDKVVSPSETGLVEITEHPLFRENSEESPEVFESKTDTVQIFDPGDVLGVKTNKIFNTWTEVLTSGNLNSLDMSDTHIWCADKSSNLWYSSIKTPGIKWNKANGFAKTISVSRSGMIIWRLYKDTVYAGTKITPKHPEGMKWVEAIRGVQSISVDNNCAWYIKSNGEVAMQKGLSKDRPCYKSTFIECHYKLQQIVCRSGVVWAITDQCKLVYRAGIRKECLEGKEWAEYASLDGLMFSCVSFGDGNVAWAVDILGRIFFMTNVTMETPLGDNCWWQVEKCMNSVPINNEVVVADFTMLDNIKSLAKIFDPQKFADILSSQRGGLIAAGIEGVWVCPECKNILHMCSGSVEGHLWSEVHLSGIVTSTAWKLISVSAIHLEWGLIWAQQPNGELFTYSPLKKNTRTVAKPPKGQFVCMSVCEEAVWGITEDGKVYIRSGIASHCPQGADWFDLDMKQLGETHLIHLSCGSKNVWAVDIDGVVYQRIGVKAPSSHSLQAAWLPVDTESTGTSFIQVFTGPSDLMVWAIDNRRQTYVRMGITDQMPIGTSWLHIPGIQVQQLAISNTFVWALDLNGEILCRHGINNNNPGGDYWRKIPGIFYQLSCSMNDKLWAINSEGLIFCRKTRYLLRKDSPAEDTQKRRASSSLSNSEDWELV